MLAMDELTAVLESAPCDRSIARQLITFFTLGGRSRPEYERAGRLLVDTGVPADIIPSFEGVPLRNSGSRPSAASEVTVDRGQGLVNTAESIHATTLRV
jgi:hypothetical protein